MAADSSRCINQYLLGKAGSPYDGLKASLKASRAPLNTLESMTFFKAEKDLLDVLLNLLSSTEDRKTTKIIHYFLSELSQYKYTNVAETKAINTIFTKELQHKDIGRKISALRNYVLLAPSDSLVEANLKDLVIGYLRKTGEEKKEGKEKEKKKFFARGTDSSRERSLIQYGALVACRHRFSKPQQQLFVPVIDAIRADDPAGARHAVFLTLEFTKEAPGNVAPNIQRFLPHLKGKEAAYLSDPLARVYFAQICTLIGLKADNKENDFFQALVQTVLDMNTRVAFEGMTSLALFPWPRLERAVLLPILSLPLSSSSSNSNSDLPLWDSIVSPTPLFSAIVKRLTASLSLTSATHSSPLVHGACRTVKALSEAYSNHLSSVEYQRLHHRQQVVVGHHKERAGEKEKEKEKEKGENVVSSPVVPLSLDDEIDEHPFSLLYPNVVALLDAPSMHVRSLALKTLVWLGLPNNEDSTKFRNILISQLVSGTLSASTIDGVFSEWLRRVQSVTHFAGLVLTLIADWCWLAPESVTFSTVFSIWKTIISFGQKGRALVLANLFEILDKDLIPQQRTICVFIKKNIFWFLGENGNILVDEIPSNYKGSVSPDINNPGLKAIVLRLSQEALLGAWEIRSICTEALAKIAILSASLTRIHIYGVATRLLEQRSAGVTTLASALVSLLDQLLEGRRKWLPTFKENPDTLDSSQLEQLYTTHVNLVAQCEVICQVPKDFCPLGPECQHYLSIYAKKNKN